MVAGQGFGSSQESQQSLQEETPSIFKILRSGPVTITGHLKDLGFSKIQLNADGDKKCQVTIFQTIPGKDSVDKKVFHLSWKNGSLVALGGSAKDPSFRIEPKAGRIVLSSNTDNGAVVYTTSKSVNVHLDQSGLKTLVSKMESFPAYWQLTNHKGDPAGKVDIEAKVGRIRGPGGQIFAEASPVTQPLGVAFVSLKPIPVPWRIALCVYFHQDDS